MNCCSHHNYGCSSEKKNKPPLTDFPLKLLCLPSPHPGHTFSDFSTVLQSWFQAGRTKICQLPLLLWKTVPEHQDNKMQRQTLPLMIQGLWHTQVQHIQRKQTCKFSAPESRPKVPAEKEADLPVEPKKTSKMLKSTAVERCMSQRSILGLLYKQWFSNITEMTTEGRLFHAPDLRDLNLRGWLSRLSRLFQESTWDTLFIQRTDLKDQQ